MTIKSWLQSLWPFSKSPEKKISQLLLQLSSAIDDLKIKIAESLAREADLRRKMNSAIVDLNAAESSNSTDNLDHTRETIDFLATELAKEERVTQRLKQIFTDLHNKRTAMELTFQQCLARIRNAETLNLLTSLHKDFGEDMKLNTYLNKFSEDSFKIEFTADSRLQIETIIEDCR